MKHLFTTISILLFVVTISSCTSSKSHHNHTKEYMPASTDVLYGVRWKESDPYDLGDRCFAAVGKYATIGIGNKDGTSDFDHIYPWSEIKRCNITDANEVVFEGETGFALDGSNGDVFVRIPKFYVQKYISEDYYYLTISETGTTLHPAFVENGKELDAIYVSAFEGYIEDDKLYSRADVIPTTNTLPTKFLKAAQTRGENYTLYDMRTVDLLFCLMAVEYGCRNSNRILGYGYSDYYQAATYHKWCIVSQNAEQTNSVVLQKPANNSTRVGILSRLSKGNNICICKGSQTNVIAQRRITSVVCNSLNDNVVVTFEGDPIDVDTTCFVGNATATCNYVETIDPQWSLTWHTGRSCRNISKYEGTTTGIDEDKSNPCRYRWIENPIGNAWHYLPDITLEKGQMYVCDNIQDYCMFKTTEPYKKVGDPLPIQKDNGHWRADKNEKGYENYWVTQMGLYPQTPGITFPTAFDTKHDNSWISKTGYGAYYYVGDYKTIIVNGGGFDHIIRCNILTNRAWVPQDRNPWYLYGARLLYKPINE